MIPPQLGERLNEALTAYGYPELTDSWNAEPTVALGRSDIASDRLQQLMRAIGAPGSDWDTDCEECFAVVADDDLRLRWIVNPADKLVTHGDGEVDFVLTGSAADL